MGKTKRISSDKIVNLIRKLVWLIKMKYKDYNTSHR